MEQILIKWQADQLNPLLAAGVRARFMDCYDLGIAGQAYELAKKYGWFLE